MAHAQVNLKHPTLKTTTRQPLPAARNLIEQGGWELDDDNTDEVTKALKDVKPGYVGGDAGSKASGGSKPADASGRKPTTTSSKAGDAR